MYIQNLKSLTKDYDVNASVFGDIDIELHRAWEEKVSDAVNLKPILPIWKQPKKQLVLDIVDYGIEAIVVSCNATLGHDFFRKNGR
ncbi:ATPase (pseudogene) [Zobellia galactanivorans]|nr:ATPase (pseudogene) [Zobellia galactanivorans]